MNSNPLSCAAALVSLAVLTVGCQSPPPDYNDPPGRVPVTTSTAAERGSNRIQPPSLIEASDEVAQNLVQDLANTTVIREAPDRATIILGDINNKTRIVSSDEFEMVRSRIRNTLLNSDYSREKLRWVENRARLLNIAAREGVGETPGASQPPAYDPETTLALNGDFYRIDRRGDKDDTNLYYMEFQLVHFATNEIVRSYRYEVKQWKP